MDGFAVSVTVISVSDVHRSLFHPLATVTHRIWAGTWNNTKQTQTQHQQRKQIASNNKITTGTSPLVLVSVPSLLHLNAHILTLSVVRLCAQIVFKWTTAMKFKIQLDAIWSKERKQKHNEVKIAIQCSSIKNKTKCRRLFLLKTGLAFVVFERRSLQRENEVKTYELGQISDVSAPEWNSSS
jgi:hypothetical protein